MAHLFLVLLFLFFSLLVSQIEHFVDPKNKKHVKFAAVADKELIFFGRVSFPHGGHADIRLPFHSLVHHLL